MTWDPLHLAALPLSAYTPGQGDPSMEGGFETATGAPMYTLESFLAGESPYVTGATNIKKPSGALVYRKIGDQVVPVRVTDYGPGVKGLDIATTNKKWATNFPFQGQRDVFTPEAYSAFAANAPRPGQDGMGVGTFASKMGAGVTPAATAVAGGTGPMSTWQDYGKVLTNQGAATKAGAAVGSALSGIGQAIASQTQAGNQQALAMLNRKSPFDSYLQSLINPGGY